MTNNIKKSQVASLFLAVLLMLTALLSGCGFFGEPVDSVRFYDDVIHMNTGTSLSINSSRIEILPELASDKSFKLESSNASILSVSGQTIKALKEGNAELTITTTSGRKTDTCIVSVTDPEPKSIKIIADGNLTQDLNLLSAINFSADFNYITAPEKEVTWTAKNSLGISVLDGGAASKTIKASQPFIFMPPEHGAFTITATITDSENNNYTDSATVSVFKPYLQSPQLIMISPADDIIQEKDDYKPVTFLAFYEDDPSNPPRIIEWFVNGVFKSNSESFTYNVTSAGIFNVMLKINGVYIGTAPITAKGDIIPTNLKVDFDNSYPDIWITWDDTGYGTEFNMGYQVEVRDANGNLVHDFDISTTHSTTGQYFANNSVNLANVIGTSKTKNLFNSSFLISVRSLGNGNEFGVSDYSQPVRLEQVSGTAKKYLGKRYYGTSGSNGYKNYYIADANELADICAYFFLWRDYPILDTKVSSEQTYEMYLAFNVDTDTELMDLIQQTFGILHFTGLMSASPSLNNNVLKLKMTYRSDSLPSMATSTASTQYVGGLNAMRPHIDYTSAKRTALPIETRTKSVSVTSSEQLYYVSQLGYKPVPVTGSKAEGIYNAAKDVLLNIINNDMTDAEKIHAIYDWVMWRVNYDHSVLNVGAGMSIENEIKTAVKYEAYYLEGVFGGLVAGETREDWPYAVCDGISKAIVLLSNMENIECIRVAGEAGSLEYLPSSWGGHAWNKVKIDGEWYIIDATWGDEIMPFRGLDGVYRNYEMAFHRYFLLTDKEVESNRREDTPNNYPKTATTPYNWYNNKFTHKGEEYDFYINAGLDEATAEMERLIDYMLDCKNGEVAGYTREYMVGKKQDICNYIAFDIKINNFIAPYFSSTNHENLIEQILQEKGLYKNSNYFLLEDSTAEGLYVFVVFAIQTT